MNVQPPGSGWRQVNLACGDWHAAEQMAVAHLGPALMEAERAGVIDSWWFIRKAASWRVRVRPTAGHHDAADTALHHLTTTAVDSGAARSWAQVVYEPEVRAFGGEDAMTIAHTLFHADSRHILHHLTHADTDHRRELSLILATRLLRAAGQDWYEQGDTWADVAAHRSTGRPPVSPTPATVGDVRRLITAAGDTHLSPLTSAPGWPAAFHRAGRALAGLAQHGTLTRGLRAVLAHHLLFTLNRHGVSAAHQHLMAAAIGHIVFQQQFTPAPTMSNSRSRTDPVKVTAVTDDNTAEARTPEQLRDALADYISSWGTFQTPEVEAAFRTVPRHMFLPGNDLETAYAPRPVVTKRGADGSAISSASSPNLVAGMLEQLGAQPGHRVLEIGAATGFNAALLAELVGPTGHVVTIELDDDLAAGARANLIAAGYDRVEVICGDGALGHPAAAPYDRIIVTAGSWDLVDPWWQQLTIGGRIVVPLRLHGSGLTRAIAFDQAEPDRMVSTSAQVCGFVPLRGSTEMIEAHLQLGEHVVLNVDVTDHPDESALRHALTLPAHEHWTGIQTRDDEPIGHLDLWLATHATDGFARFAVAPEARESGLLNPALRWAGAALYDDENIAYLALRPHRGDPSELGVIAHGPDSEKFASRFGALLHRWHREQATLPVITAERAVLGAQPPAMAHLVRPESWLTVTW